ncbi:hypothetical protein EA473_02685 [Natrarchaeobius chitinivorans]|uniref:Uncharacterized protein n=1 Tax=Natrarchaeobius chitinivorans TaxID=1679083 RepID=A0A3N6PGS0_NATCH|nr:hypothetical protein EA473_02685 [Natrarchaeobius chitinivorans]
MTAFHRAQAGLSSYRTRFLEWLFVSFVSCSVSGATDGIDQSSSVRSNATANTIDRVSFPGFFQG